MSVAVKKHNVTVENYVDALGEELGENWTVAKQSETRDGALLTYSIGDAEGYQSAAMYSLYALPEGGFYEYGHEDECELARASTLRDLIGILSDAYDD